MSGENHMKTLILALAVLSMAVIIPGAADAHIGTTGDCWDYEVYADPWHKHVCVSVTWIREIIGQTLA